MAREHNDLRYKGQATAVRVVNLSLDAYVAVPVAGRFDG